MPRRRRSDLDTMSWIILLAGVISVVFYSLIMAVAYGAENGNCVECNVTIWELRYQGATVSAGDMTTEEECLALMEEIDTQTPGFSLECVEIWVQREKS